MVLRSPNGRTKLAKAEDARKREEKMKRRAEKRVKVAARMVAVRERSTAKREARKKLQSEKRERGKAKDRECVLVRTLSVAEL